MVKAAKASPLEYEIVYIIPLMSLMFGCFGVMDLIATLIINCTVRRMCYGNTPIEVLELGFQE